MTIFTKAQIDQLLAQAQIARNDAGEPDSDFQPICGKRAIKAHLHDDSFKKKSGHLQGKLTSRDDRAPARASRAFALSPLTVEQGAGSLAPRSRVLNAIALA